MNRDSAILICVWIIMLLLSAHVWRHWDDAADARLTTKYLQMLYEHAK